MGPAPLTRPPWPEIEALVKALALPGVGSAALREAVRRSGGAVGAARELAGAVWPRLRDAERERVAGWARSALRTLAAEPIHVLTPELDGWPPGLAHVHEPPWVIFARGRLDRLRRPLIAVVGTRRCTDYGARMARRIAGGIRRSGAIVVSGLALGVDGHAHVAAGPPRTVGVLGCGIDVVYPRAHAALQRAMGREGLLLTEQLPGAPPAAHHFPRRNRLIAGLARGVVVIEAPHGSGALITAELALDLGRPVFVVPGEVGRPTSAGSNALIRDGATLVTSAEEVLEALELPPPPPGAGEDIAPAGLDGLGLALWRSLGTEPRHADDVASAVGVDLHQGLASLLSLEVLGHARQLPGFRFVRA